MASYRLVHHGLLTTVDGLTGLAQVAPVGTAGRFDVEKGLLHGFGDELLERSVRLQRERVGRLRFLCNVLTDYPRDRG
jgi:hypothetical protein